MVGNSAFLADDEVAGFAEVIDEFRSLGLGGITATVRDQITEEFFFAPRATGRVLPKMFQHLGLPFIQGGRFGLGR